MNSTTAAYRMARSPPYPTSRDAIRRTAGRIRLPPLVRMYWPICGMSATLDWTWRANSSSTFARSARIGSKICDRASDDFSTGFRLKTLSRPEQGMKVRPGLVGDAARRQLVQLGEHGRNAADVGRLVPLATVGHRRQKWA